MKPIKLKWMNSVKTFVHNNVTVDDNSGENVFHKHTTQKFPGVDVTIEYYGDIKSTPSMAVKFNVAGEAYRQATVTPKMSLAKSIAQTLFEHTLNESLPVKVLKNGSFKVKKFTSKDLHIKVGETVTLFKWDGVFALSIKKFEKDNKKEKYVISLDGYTDFVDEWDHVYADDTKSAIKAANKLLEKYLSEYFFKD